MEMITSRPECSEASLRHVSGLEPLDDLSTGRRSLYARMQDQHFALLPPVRSFCLPAFLVPLNWFMARLLYLPAALVLLSYVAAFALFEPRYGWLAVAAVHLVSSWFAHPLRLRKIMTDIALVPPDVTTPDLAARRIAWSRAGNRLGLAILPGCLVASAIVVLLRVFGAKFPADHLPKDFHVGGHFLGGAIIVTALSVPWLIYALQRFRTGLGVHAVAACLGLGVVAGGVAAFWNMPVIILTTGFIPGKIAEAFGISATAGLVEEGAKLAALAFIAMPQFTSRPQRDAPLLGLLVGLGFGMAENLQYAGYDHAFLAGLARAATAVPTHGMIGLIMGWLLARAMATSHHRGRGLILAWAAPALCILPMICRCCSPISIPIKRQRSASSLRSILCNACAG